MRACLKQLQSTVRDHLIIVETTMLELGLLVPRMTRSISTFINLPYFQDIRMTTQSAGSLLAATLYRGCRFLLFEYKPFYFMPISALKTASPKLKSRSTSVI